MRGFLIRRLSFSFTNGMKYSSGRVHDQAPADEKQNVELVVQDFGTIQMIDNNNALQD